MSKESEIRNEAFHLVRNIWWNFPEHLKHPKDNPYKSKKGYKKLTRVMNYLAEEYLIEIGKFKREVDF